MNLELIESFEHACEVLGVDPNILPGIEGLPEIIGKRQIAAYKLEIIEMATVGDWKADFSDDNQDKWTPWLWYNPAVGGFVCTCADCARTHATLGARFWFPDTNTAAYFAKQHKELIDDLMRSR